MGVGDVGPELLASHSARGAVNSVGVLRPTAFPETLHIMSEPLYSNVG